MCYEGLHLYAIRVADCKVIGHVDCHTVITCLKLCRDQRTLVVGCEDGSLVSYVIVDPYLDYMPKILENIPSRILADAKSTKQCLWDRADTMESPPYSRPPSAAVVNTGLSDRDILRKVRPVSRARPDSSVRMSARNTAIGSRACIVMWCIIIVLSSRLGEELPLQQELCFHVLFILDIDLCRLLYWLGY